MSNANLKLQVDSNFVLINSKLVFFVPFSGGLFEIRVFYEIGSDSVPT